MASQNAVNDNVGSYESSSLHKSTPRKEITSSPSDKDVEFESNSSDKIDGDSMSFHNVSLPPPQRSKTRLPPKNEQIDNRFYSGNSDNQNENSTVSAYSSFGHTSFQKYTTEILTTNEDNTLFSQIENIRDIPHHDT